MSGTSPVASAPAVREGTTPSIVRTVTPVVVGYVLTYLLGVETGWLRDLATSFGLTEDSISTGLTLTVASILTSVYYAVVRWLEGNFPQAGVLLGMARQPVYVNARTAAATRLAD